MYHKIYDTFLLLPSDTLLTYFTNYSFGLYTEVHFIKGYLADTAGLMTLLREFLFLDLSPLANNIIASQLMVVVFKIALEGICRVYGRFGHSDYTRQLTHMLMSASVVFWPLFDTQDWSWRLNVLVPAALMSRYFYKGAVLKDPDDIEVRIVSRTSSPTSLLFGPLQFAVILVWLGLYRFMTEEAAIIAAAIGIGDGLAPMIGKVYGRHNYQMPLASPKTMEGSVVGVFLGTIAGCYLYLYMMGIPLLPLRMVLVYGGIAAVVEGTAPGNLDNLTVPIAIHFSIDKVQEMLPA